MTDRLDQAKSIFLEAIDSHAPEQWPAFLDRACGGDLELRADVEKLLYAQGQIGSFHERPRMPPGGLDGVADSTTASNSSPGTAGLLIAGRYKLLEPIGEGGMGTVWMAQQTEPVKRQVAVKLIKPGMDSRQVLSRFDAERQALALMDHPNIAKVFDGGMIGEPDAPARESREPLARASGSSRPYFVMELVKGVSITKYCDEHQLTPRQRLELFVPVCHAIQHAHQKGIIHRDLKPSNILVALYDDKPVPKVIDFGVAKATGQQLTEQTLHTSFGAVVGTVEYMSPEQATFNQLDIDTRSDIYSLGVLLYELLTGTTPLQKKRLKEAALLEVLRLVREEEPPRPSTRLSTTEELPSIAANRGLEPKKLSGQVRGELDWIVMKALEKDRNRRYETANGLAMDVQRFLADEPVLACPPSAGYRLRKFARRNRARLALATALGLLLLGAGAFAWHADRQTASRERDERARLERNADAVATLLDHCEDALRADDADRAAVALGAAERRVADGGVEDLVGPLDRCRADLRLLRELDAINTFDWTWSNTGPPDDEALAARYRAALADYGVPLDEGRAEEAAGRVNGSLVRDRVLAALDWWLAVDASAAGRGVLRAIDSWAGLRAVLRAADPDPFRDALRTAEDAPSVRALAGRPEALAQPARFAVVLGRRSDVPTDRRRVILESALQDRPGDLAILMELGGSYRNDRADGVGERVRWFQAAVAAHPGNVAARNSLGIALMDRGDLDGAITSFRNAIRLEPGFMRLHYNLGLVLDRKGDPEGAIACFQEAIRQDANYSKAHTSLGAVLLNAQGADAAIPHLEKATRLNPKNAAAHYNLGLARKTKGDTDGAISAYRTAVGIDPNDAAAHIGLGVILCDVKRDYDGAITAFQEAIRINPKKALAHFNLGNALWNKRDYDGAIAAFRDAIRINPKYASAHFSLGLALWSKRDVDGAIASFREAIQHDRDFSAAHWRLAGVLANGPDGVRDGKQAVEHATRACELTGWNDPVFIATLAAAYAETGDFDRAVEFQRKALAIPGSEKRLGKPGRDRLQLYEQKKPYRDPAFAPRKAEPKAKVKP